MKNYYYLKQGILLMFLLFIQSFNLIAQSEQYLHFDGVNDYVVLENGSQYIVNSTEITMAGWFYTDQLAYGQGMMGIRDGSGNGMYVIQLDNGIMECRLETNTGLHEFVAPAFTIVPQTWQHIAWVYDGASVRLYINGTLKGSSVASGTISNANIHFAIGRSILSNFNFYFGGRVDEVSLWSKVLNQTDIQNMMENELVGDEAGLEAYYKFNQGVPYEDNTSITEAVSEVGAGERDAQIINFALTGETSNFGGDLNVGFQAITFPQIPNKLTTDAPFNLNASASSGLDVIYEVVSGPASVSGNTVTLDGVAGQVMIKATQPGDGTYQPADELLNTFQVIDPTTYAPAIEARSPLAGDVFVPSLSAIQLAAIVDIGYPELFSVQNVSFEIDGQSIPATDWNNNHYTGWWTPPAYGSYTLDIIASSNYGATYTESVNINIVETAVGMDVLAADDVWLNTSISSQIVQAELPSYQGAYNQITATLDVNCPNGSCGEWDRVASVDAKGHNGEWIEIFRYITPYGVPCSHTIDLTDYMSILQGKIAFRLNCGTLDNGFLYDLTISYSTGTPEYPYSSITRLWNETYPFGDPDNLQPCPPLTVSFPANAVASTLKLVSTGHGWGDNNTGNAAEFHDDTHHVWVNGSQTFEQHNWSDCNPNPDGCSPQNGTWFYDRAGWCPGSIAPWFDFNMTPFLGDNVALEYIFDEDYVDNCHPNNPGCISGVTCPDCNDGFNPHLIVATNLVTFSGVPLVEGVVVNSEDLLVQQNAVSIFPNPSSGLFTIGLEKVITELQIRIINNTGQLVKAIHETDNQSKEILLNMSELPKGIYLIDLFMEGQRITKKLILE
ncbi:MAG: T9SS type A sorting domain-containing protein [Saprospiraceae bacterium]|nr:T9SS type A sorting domain-containing protein [Saprospiraceae bacterium]MCB9322817.1 T9SS type A sorting domain-containing protein [Lewinellaceae bacterium]